MFNFLYEYFLEIIYEIIARYYNIVSFFLIKYTNKINKFYNIISSNGL